MKVLLDNCTPRSIRRLLPEHEVIHTRELGWQELQNGTLLRTAAEAGFVVMVTVDKNIKSQQHLPDLPLTVIEVDTHRSTLPEIEPLADLVIEAMRLVETHRFLIVNHRRELIRLQPL